MARKLYKFVNEVSWRTNLPSWKNLKRDSERLGKELGGASTGAMMKATKAQEKELIASRTKLADKLRREDEKARAVAKRQASKDSQSGFQSAISGLTQTSGLKASQTVFAERMRQEDALAKKQQAGMDTHVRAFRARNRQQEKFLELQDKVIRRFMLSNREIRQMSEAERNVYINKLKNAKSAKDLLHTERRLKAEIQDNLHFSKMRTRELNKQTLAQRRLTSSTEQMVGALASVYTAAAAGQAVIRVGQDFESFEKTFLAVSKNVEDAAEQMQFARDTAQYLGSDLIETGKAYSRMIGAVGDKAPLQDVRDIFLATNEAAVVLGLSADDTAGSLRAIQQILGKGRFMAEEVRQQLGKTA